MKQNRLALFDGSTVDVSPERILPEQILLVRFGTNFYTRNGEEGEFDFTPEDADAVIADFEQRGRDLVIDFEHQSLGTGKAPAAGWISKLEKTPEGLLATVRYWTQEAAEFLLKGEYRYFSPTLYFSRSGQRVSAIHSAALTNHPAMHGSPALVASDSGDEKIDAAVISENQHKGNQMKELLEQLDLEAFKDVSEEEQHSEISRRIGELLNMQKSLSDFLSQWKLKDLEEAKTRLQSLRNAEEEQLLVSAFSDGKLTECLRSWAENFVHSDPEAFSRWCSAAPRIVPENPAGNPFPMNDCPARTADPEEEKILSLLGVSASQLKKKTENHEKKGDN